MSAGGRADRRAPGPGESAAAPHGARRLVHAAVALLIFLLCAGLYAWTVDFPMVFDDEPYLINNPLFKDSRSFSYPLRFTEFANRPAKLSLDLDLATNFMMRPATYGTLHLNWLFDGFKPRWYRAVNIVIHAGGAVLVYALLHLLLRRREAGAAARPGAAAFIPVVTALLFAAHPIATESVTYIVQRFTSQSTLFYLLTLCLYFASLQAAARVARSALRAASVAALLLGMLSKECVFTAPVMAVCIDWLVNRAPLRTALWRALPLLAFMPLIPLLVILIAAAQHGGHIALHDAVHLVNGKVEPFEHWHYAVTQTTVVAAYLGRIIWPAGLNLDPDWPLHRSLLEAPVLRSLAVFALLLGGVGGWWRARRDDVRVRLALTGVIWFFVTVSMSSGVVPLPDLMADHRAYLPSIGIFVLVAVIMDRVRHAGPLPGLSRGAVSVVAAACVVALASSTCVRNETWRTAESLWTDTTEKSPRKYRVWGNLGAAHSNHGNEVEAVKCYEQALKIEPRFQAGIFNLSNSLLRLGRPQESLEASVRLVRMDERAARHPTVVFTVGLGLAGVGRYDDAAAVFKEILAVRPDDVRCHQALGSVYLNTNRPALALEHFRAAAARSAAPDESLLASIKMAEEMLGGAASFPASVPLIRLR